MTEPIFVRQNDELSLGTSLGWFRSMNAVGSAEGATWFRCSSVPTGGRDHNNYETVRCLIEGWTEQPQDQGEPRWRKE